MAAPPWLESLRKTAIVKALQADSRTVDGNPLGIESSTAFHDVVCGGQADFDAPWKHLSPMDRAMLYAYWNQRAHIDELIEAFTMLFTQSTIDDPIVVDLGCGPFTGGLALAATLPAGSAFTYIGMDRSATMRQLGERLADAGIAASGRTIDQQWVASLGAVTWTKPPGWRPVIVIVSYLLASPSLDPVALVAELEGLLQRLGRGQVTVLYTNAIGYSANRNFPAFSTALEEVGFKIIADDNGAIKIYQGTKTRQLKYALFHRDRQRTLDLGD